MPNLVLGILSGTGVPPIIPPPVSGYKLWLDASDTSSITASGGDVSQWNDKSGNASNFTQGTGANQPKTGTRTLNSLNLIDFDGSNDFMSVPSSTALFNYLHNSTGATVFVVGIVDDTATNKVFFGNNNGGSANIGILYFATSAEKTNTFITNGNSGLATVSNADANTLVAGNGFYLTNIIDPNNATAANRSKEALNNGSYITNNTLTNAPSASDATINMCIGGTDTGGAPLDGALGEIIFYEGILSQPNIDLVESYLATKWGI